MSAIPHSQKIALVLVPKASALASILGSAWMLRDLLAVLRNDSYDRGSQEGVTSRHRILAGMCVFDVLSSTAWFMTSWPIPQEGVAWTLWNVGTVQTCSAQGFFIHMAMGTILYNACLALYYLLAIRYSVKNPGIANYWEPWMHLVSIGFPLGTGMASLLLGLYNPVGWSCTITAYPPWCTQSVDGQGVTDCIRGDNAKIYNRAFWLGPAVFVWVFLVLSMGLIFCKIRRVENNTLAYSAASFRASTTSTTQSHSNNRPGHLQRRFVVGAIYYVGAMLVTWSLHLGTFIYYEVTGHRINYWLSLGAAIMLPLQGFFNACIYFRRPPAAVRSSRRSSRPPSDPPSFALSRRFGDLSTVFFKRKPPPPRAGPSSLEGTECCNNRHPQKDAECDNHPDQNDNDSAKSVECFDSHQEDYNQDQNDSAIHKSDVECLDSHRGCIPASKNDHSTISEIKQEGEKG